MDGLPATLFITACGLLIGFGIGVTLALIRVYAGRGPALIATGYEKVFRGIPLLVLMFILFVSSGAGAWLAAILALGMISGAYQSQIIRGAILSVDPQQLVAARSVGMTGLQSARHIVLPQAFRLAVPAWCNEYAVVIKDSAFASALPTVVEMVRVLDYLKVEQPTILFTGTLVITILYFMLTYPVTRFVGERQSARLRRLGLGGGKA